MTFVKSTDSLLINCSYMNTRDFTNCIPIFPGEDGYVILKSHDASFYSYLSITTTLVDEFRSYESTFDFHPSLESGVYNELLTSLKRNSSSPYIESHLYQITLLRHSILCRDIFYRFYDGCSKLPLQSQIHIEVGFQDISSNSSSMRPYDSLLTKSFLSQFDSVSILLLCGNLKNLLPCGLHSLKEDLYHNCSFHYHNKRRFGWYVI